MNKIIYRLDRLTEDGSGFRQDLDFLFVAAGADFRAYEVLRKLSKSSKSVKKVILIDYFERKDEEDLFYSNNYNSYKDLSNIEFCVVPANIKNPSSCIKHLHKIGIEIGDKDKVAIDISCFTKPYFFQLITFFAKIIKLDSIEVFYTEPKSYMFSTGSYDSFKSTSGPTQIRELMAGSDSKDLERVLLILLGFDGDISREIDEEISPSLTMIVNGFPGYLPKFKDISLINNEKLVSNENNIQLLYSKANNPFDTYNLIEKIVRDMDSKRYVNIAPLGTKPMALGACLFAIHHPEVRVICPFPENYSNITTEECWHSWNYLIPLNLESSYGREN